MVDQNLRRGSTPIAAILVLLAMVVLTGTGYGQQLAERNFDARVEHNRGFRAEPSARLLRICGDGLPAPT
jgi:hypothetical protein